MAAEHIRPDGGLYHGYYCLRCGAGGVNMYATGHGPDLCEPNPELVASLNQINK